MAVSATDTSLDSVSNVLNLGFETVLAVGVVLHDTLGSIGLIQGVRSLDNISITHLPLALVVSGVDILYSVLELVLGIAVVVQTTLFLVASLRITR